jgi:hypothetical protein
MPRYTRRRILRDLGVASAAGAASVLLPGCKKKTKATVPSDLYLILPGSWLFCFEDGGINAVTTDLSGHTYDFGLSPPQNQTRVPIEKDQTYTVAVSGYMPAPNSQALVTDMKNASQGIVFSNVTRDRAKTSGLRTIKLPMPSKIHPAALLKGVSIGIDPAISQIPSIQQWPAALALIYSGGWSSVSVTSSDANQSTVTVSPDQHNHLSFRTCQTSKCGDPGCGGIDCKQIEADVTHAHMVFDSLMTLLQFPNGKSGPTITFPQCVPDASGVGGTFNVTVDRGADYNIDTSEIGMPARCQLFGHLHNCAAGAGIVGS